MFSVFSCVGRTYKLYLTYRTHNSFWKICNEMSRFCFRDTYTKHAFWRISAYRWKGKVKNKTKKKNLYTRANNNTPRSCFLVTWFIQKNSLEDENRAIFCETSPRNVKNDTFPTNYPPKSPPRWSGARTIHVRNTFLIRQ